MQKRIIAILFVLSLLSLALFGCSNNQDDQNDDVGYDQVFVDTLQNEIDQLNTEISTLKAEILDLNAEIAEQVDQVVTEEPEQATTSLLTSALDVMALIEDQDFAALQNWVHPDDGVRFSPYAYVNTQTDLVFGAQVFPTLPTDPTILTWGSFDGSGDPIDFDFLGYYNRFIYDQDYLNPEIIGVNTIIGTGNTLVNIIDVYPSGEFVEFHFTGFDPQYEGMDWRSLILVFEEVGNEWKLVGIVHNEWTI